MKPTLRARSWLAVAAVLALATPVSAASSGGVVLTGSGCRTARVTVPRRLRLPPVHTLTTRGTYATWIMYRGKRATADETYFAALLWPAVSGKSLPMSVERPLVAGDYTVVLCSDRSATLRLDLPGAKRWTNVATKATGPREATITNIGTAAEVAVARGPLSHSTPTFSFLVVYRMGGVGATNMQACFTERGGLCSTSQDWVTTRGETSSDRSLFLRYGTAPKGPPVDGVVEMVGTRPYLQDSDRLLVASIPTP